jgi:hypothetical protein
MELEAGREEESLGRGRRMLRENILANF